MLVLGPFATIPNNLISCCGTLASSEEIEDKEDDDVEDNQKRYDLRQRKTVVPYQAPLESRLCTWFFLRVYFFHRSEIDI